MRKLLFMATLALLATACHPHEDSDKAPITKPEITIQGGRLTPEALWAMGRINSVLPNEATGQIAYTVSYYSVQENRSTSWIRIAQEDNGKLVTTNEFVGYEPTWVGNQLAYLKAGKLYLPKTKSPIANQHACLEGFDKDIEGFLLSPKGDKIILIAQVKTVASTEDKYPDLPLASGRVVNDLMYKHWDEWVTTVPHPFLYDYDGKTLSNERDIIEGEPFECPLKPFGGAEQLAFSPDGKLIAYTCKKLSGQAYALSTNTDIYLYDVAEGKTVANLSKDMMGYDINPTFSPDGTKLAWESMEHDGYESDKNRLFVIDLATRTRTYITADFDQNANSLQWDAEGKHIYFISCWHGCTQVYKANIETKEIKQLTEGQHDYEQIALCGNKIIGVRHSMSMPNEVYSINPENGEQTQITFENRHLLDQLQMGKVEPRWVPTTDGKEMLVWVIYPANFDPAKKYPTLLYCQGGPQSPVSQFWSYRWNFQIMASNDYIIVAPNRRGLVGFGQEWLEAISKDYGGQCMRDYFSAIDHVAQEPFVDKDRLGCVGASFGGYSVYWMAGHHEGRFKAFIAHDGMFNLEQQYLETEEMFFVNWDLGGPYWDAKTAETYANSPHKFVDKWDTPIMVIHGETDYRILASQGMSAYNAAKLRGIPAELLIFPDENHWVLQPQNSVLWQRRFFNWLDRWLK